jgi:hypothetical protein
MGRMVNSYRTLARKPERKDHFLDTGVDGWMLLKWILNSVGVCALD